jgi:hypothetical protein
MVWWMEQLISPAQDYVTRGGRTSERASTTSFPDESRNRRDDPQRVRQEGEVNTTVKQTREKKAELFRLLVCRRCGVEKGVEVIVKTPSG